MVEKRVAVRMVSEGGQQVRAELQGIGRDGSRAFSQLGSSAGGMRGNIQNASFQIADFAVQVGSGTSAARALAQQLPQLLAGFGVLGAVIGAGAAVLLPFASNLFETGSSAEDVSKKIDGLNEALRNYRQAVEGASFDGLVKQFGAITPEIVELQRQLQELRLAEVMINAASAAQLLASQFDGTMFQNAFNQAQEFLGIENLFIDEGVVKVKEFQTQLEALAQATTFSDQIAAIDALQAVIIDAAGGVGNMTEEQRAFYAETLNAESALRAAEAAAGGVAAATGGAADEAGRLAGNAAAAASALDALSRANMQAAQDYSGAGRGGDPRRFMSPDSGPKPLTAAAQNLIDAANRSASRAAGGGGGGGIDKDLREAERWFEKTRTAAEKYNAELAELNELQRAGKIDAETYARAIKLIEEKYKGAGDSAKFFESLQDDLKNGFLDAIVAGESLSDVFQNLAQSIAKAALEAALFGSGPFAAGSGGLLSSIFGGGGGAPIKWFADGGVVNRTTAFGLSGGGVGVMGEAGPEAILPLVRASGGALGVRAVGGGSDAPQRVIVEVHPSGEFDARVAGTSQRVAVEVVRGYDRVQPQRVKQILRDERRVG